MTISARPDVNSNDVARKRTLRRAFRISGTFAIASLITLVAFSFHGSLAVAAWTISGVSLLACLRIAWLMQDSERAAKVFDALWLRSTESVAVGQDAAGDTDADAS